MFLVQEHEVECCEAVERNIRTRGKFGKVDEGVLHDEDNQDDE